MVSRRFVVISLSGVKIIYIRTVEQLINLRCLAAGSVGDRAIVRIVLLVGDGQLPAAV
jgi:hypothetical protein